MSNFEMSDQNMNNHIVLHPPPLILVTYNV